MPEGLDFDIGHKLGYYILAIFLISALFLFLAVFIGGVKTAYFKADYGVNTINVEEKVFSCISYTEPLTHIQRQRTIDLEKYKTVNLDACIGTVIESRDDGVAINISVGGVKIAEDKENSAFLHEQFGKDFPVAIYDNGVMTQGILHISFWRT